MTLLQWKPSYTLGVPSVDHEHRELIDLINQAYSHMERDSAPDRIEACLEDIHAAISLHFALEERHMRQAGYPEFQAHKDEHEELLDQIRDMMDEFADDPESGERQLRAKLADWFGQHFATYDARLHHKLGDHQ
jgi:hemerythrin-like metal-binding protein